MANLERLAMQHAKWSRVKRETKKEAGKIVCERQLAEGEREPSFKTLSTENCIERVYRLVSNINAEQPYDDLVSFADVWAGEIIFGNVCPGCVRIRELKRQRVDASRKLGQIRSAITKAGEHLLKDGE